MPLVRPKPLHNLIVPKANDGSSHVLLVVPIEPARAPTALQTTDDESDVEAPAREVRRPTPPKKVTKVLTPSPVRWDRAPKVWKGRPPTPLCAGPPMGDLCAELPGSSAFLCHVNNEAVAPPKWQRETSHLQVLRQLKHCASQKGVRDGRIEQLLGELVVPVVPQPKVAAIPQLQGDGMLARRAAEDARLAASEAKTAVAKIRELCGGRSARAERQLRAAPAWAKLDAAAGTRACAWSGKQWWEGHSPVRAWELGF